MRRNVAGLDRFVAWSLWQVWCEPVGWLDELEYGLERLGLHGAARRVQALEGWFFERLQAPLSTLERRLCSWGEVPGRSLD